MIISNTEYKEFIKNINNGFSSKYVIPFASPVLYFGNIEHTQIATLGINPSNKEFMDNNNNEINGEFRRFHTLQSLNISNWEELDQEKYSKIITSFNQYFTKNPYNLWFKQLDYLLSSTTYSYYFPYNNLVHLDLTPVVTFEKWGNIPLKSQNELLKEGAIILKKILRNTSINTLILNGRYAIKIIEGLSGTHASFEHITSWDLLRSNNSIKGYAYEFEIERIVGFDLDRKIRILGYNYNIQSSYGITNEVRDNIRNWLKNKIL